MAGPTVTLTFAGDADRLEGTMDNVGAASERMADRVGSASDEVRNTSEAFDQLGEATDTSESRFQGFADTITGVQDITTGFREGDIVGMATGFADLAGGMTEFVVPALSSFASFLAGPLRTAMTFISSHPLLIFFGLLVGAVILLWTTSQTFRDVVIGVFDAVAGFISRVFGGVISWIVDRWNGVVDWFANLPSRIAGALGSLGGMIQGAFKGALNIAIDALNWAIDRINDLIYGINLVNPFSDIPSIPHLKRLHTGGVVPGMPGEEVLAILQGGETVSPNGSGSAVTVAFTGDTNSAFATAFMNLVRTGQIQLSAG